MEEQSEEKIEIAEEEAFTDDGLSEILSEGDRVGCGDAIVEEFSIKNKITGVAQATGISAKIVNYIFAAIYFVVGVLCVSITEIITHVLPYIVGSLMITAALGVMIIVESVKPDSVWAITFISIVWGVLGLFEGAHAFNHAFARMANSQRSAFYLVKGFVEVAVAFMLLYQPGNHDIHTFHIIVFGINLMIDAITMLPAVKKFLQRSSSVE